MDISVEPGGGVVREIIPWYSILPTEGTKRFGSHAESTYLFQSDEVMSRVNITTSDV